jgi:DNA-binding MarR family transcriptional regulator/N-acetylglutamate synthase-like GNAT family acetyltransferase
MSDAIPRIRSFHRTVTQRIGALNSRYLGRDRPLVESRMLFEIGADGAGVRELRARLGLDPGFVSRTLRILEGKGLIKTIRRTDDDGRLRFVRLTRAGKAELRTLNELSDELAQSILTPLTPEQGKRLVTAMAEVERLLMASAVVLDVEKPGSHDAVWCLDQYFQELDVRFRKGFDPQLTNSASADELTPPKGYLIVARLFGEPVGCGALRITDRATGEVKRMWVATRVRGLGMGRKILDELERIAHTRSLTILRLETNESLKEAQSLYRTAGYTEVAAFNDEPYAHHWFQKRIK